MSVMGEGLVREDTIVKNVRSVELLRIQEYGPTGRKPAKGGLDPSEIWWLRRRKGRKL